MHDATDVPPVVVDHILDIFELRGLVVLAKTIGARHIISVSPELIMDATLNSLASRFGSTGRVYGKDKGLSSCLACYAASFC